MPPCPDEFASLYIRHERKLYRYVASLLVCHSDVDDLMQETARVLWQKFSEYRRGEPFLPWAQRIAYYEVLNYCQRQRTRWNHLRPAVIELLADTRAKHNDLLEAQSHWLGKCLEKLPENDRLLVKQRYSGEGTLAAVAGETGRTSNALYKAMQRIRLALLRCVKKGLKSEGWE
ncbi:MAG: sigma-70 family RNA polymerase sigma factor [Thermoguttaceae bacterium]